VTTLDGGRLRQGVYQEKKMFFSSQSHVITSHEKWAFYFNNTLTWPQEFKHVQYNLLAFHRNSSLILFIMKYTLTFCKLLYHVLTYCKPSLKNKGSKGT